MKTPSQVSVVIPTYNRADQLHKALQSAIEQTVMPEEIIVVDDCSTDATEQVVSVYPNVIYLKQDANQGAAAARNRGVAAATKEFVAFLDSDDIWEKTKLEQQLDYFSKTPQCDVLATGVVCNERNGLRRVSNLSGYESYYPHWPPELFATYPFSTPTWMVRRNFLLKYGLFDEKYPPYEDFESLLRMDQHGQVHLLAAPLLVKNNSDDSVSFNYEKAELSMGRLVDAYAELWKKQPLVPTKVYIRVAMNYAQCKNMAAARKALKKLLKVSPLDARVRVIHASAYLGGATFFLAVRLLKPRTVKSFYRSVTA